MHSDSEVSLMLTDIVDDFQLTAGCCCFHLKKKKISLALSENATLVDLDPVYRSLPACQATGVVDRN